ncbi:uncharacterized protein CMU_015440 [Cryptosporidium muris RN66]|uniref:Replication termination factor 2 n=1 Tax=Cryptosporidium muris (strain RN66) TaxID=441375 RepID=B6AEC1_CRYMR|nr:uncharacterized protein CMU_015440 [Cryptosporidium muris RN66]EEA06867.1 hypothetical protein, conserved [Cryptosporidium muris RN66]|eukprot:XP_002141216.1 hypothetical protein [Cryptosporidium muris RN66]
MGGDGGSIPKRSDIVKTSGYRYRRNLGGMGYLPNTTARIYDETIPESTQRHIKWTSCALTLEPLKQPIVACRLGNLYNKESLLKRLIKGQLSSEFSHIKSIRDLADIKFFLSLNLLLKNKINKLTGCLICPITLSDLDNFVRAKLYWKCGCIISENALKIQSDSEFEAQCMNCNSHYIPNTDDIIMIPNSEELSDLKERLRAINSKKRKLNRSSERAPRKLLSDHL